MTRSRPITFLASAAVIPLVALAVAACGGGGAATPRRRRRPRAAPRRQSASRMAASDRSWSTRPAAPCTCSRPIRRHERVLGRVRDRVAAAAGNRQADGRHRTDRLQARNDHPLGRQPAGDLQRPSALPVHQGPKARPNNRAGRDGVRRRLVRADSVRKSGLGACIELRRRCELRRRWLLAKRPTPAQANRRSNHDT